MKSDNDAEYLIDDDSQFEDYYNEQTKLYQIEEKQMRELEIEQVECREPLWQNSTPLVERSKNIKQKMWQSSCHADGGIARPGHEMSCSRISKEAGKTVFFLGYLGFY